jgi:hypothetical protein
MTPGPHHLEQCLATLTLLVRKRILVRVAIIAVWRREFGLTATGNSRQIPRREQDGQVGLEDDPSGGIDF